MLLERIRQAYPELSKSQRKLADFIADSYSEAAFMTASEMAQHLDLNEATVIRFAQRLGYPGYPHLIRDIQNVVQDELRAHSQAGADGHAEEPFLTSLHVEVEQLRRLPSHVSPQLARRLLAIIWGARHIYVTGEGVSYHLAAMLAAGLAGVGYDVRLIPADSRSLALAIASLEAADALVGVVASEGGLEVAQAIGVARERGARTLAICWSPVSRAALAAETALCCPPAADHLPARSVAPMAVLLDALVQAAAAKDEEGMRRFAQESARLARRLRAT